MSAPAEDATLDAHLAQLRRTDEAAWMEAVFREFYAPLGQVIYRVVPDRAAVEDLLQDVLLRLWQGRAELPELQSHRAYLTRAALNAALRYQQRGQRQVAWEAAPAEVVPTASPDALAALHHADTETAVAAALDLLPPQCRTVFELSRYEELSYQQIAETLEISPKTVENQMGKALRVLRGALAGALRNLYGLVL
ncbi:sigma-70 family RNA polymerase sigma factor [Hymenobacter negativus]|uniref:Sigma-70 family RNA polymerase sigma factor n=1 Tax=Hymenobacter negativus TaxID=2795026 RepID=A0ABS3QE21_9BACT|nr:sigma-70 family RNA polymerase sigma factor [Hymenobacter negativus]MBO2009248.1 sigma-70 family RNA polymerase sigma factor [Hymenobacter negativus]